MATLGHYGAWASAHHGCDHNHIDSHSQVDGGKLHEPLLHLFVQRRCVLAGLCCRLEPWVVV